MERIGFIGAGNMGYAMLEGLVGQIGKEQILFTDLSEERRTFVSDRLKIMAADNNIEVIQKAKYIVLAVKPQFMALVMEEIKQGLTKEHIVITLAPGISIEKMKSSLGEEVRVCRTMPNTPALVAAGMSVLSFSNDRYLEGEKKQVMDLFRSFGEIEVLEERYMDAVVPVSGSSPAYVYMLIEAMADAAVLAGLPRKTAYKLAAQSVLGSAKMVLETDLHPGELKDQVCSPGGTTIEAVAVLEKNGFRSAVIEAMKECYAKVKKMQI